VRWEFAGESIPEAIQAALDGRRVLPIVEAVPVVVSPVGEPDWDKLAGVLLDLRDVLRGYPTREETTAWVKAVNAEARRLDQQWDTNIARKNAQAVAHGLPIEAGAVLLNAVQQSDNDAFVQLASGGTLGSVQQLVTSQARIHFYSVVVPKKVETRKKLLKALIDADAVGIAQYNTSATRWSVLWSTGVVEIMEIDDLELASEERRAQMLPAIEGGTVLYANKRTANRGTLRRLKPSGKWEIEFEGGTLASEYDKGVIVLAHPKGAPTESWWIDEDDSIFRDDDPVPEHFAILRGPFTSRVSAEQVLKEVVTHVR
jgi:hypothetical protein